MYIKEETFSKVYKKLTYELLNNPEFICSPRDQKINECINVQFEILDPYMNMFTNSNRKNNLSYLAKELVLYFSGVSTIEYYEKASKFWSNIKTPCGHINSAYGNLIFNNIDDFGSNTRHQPQWEWARNSLIKDKDSRQAIIHYNRIEHQYESNKDFVCTMLNQFFIRDDLLYMNTYIRSNDIFFGLTYDATFFMLLMQCMKKELVSVYPNLELGSYTHFAGSMHAYERDFTQLLNMLNGEWLDKSLIINENPIKHPIILELAEHIKNDEFNFKYSGNDKFFAWLDKNRRVEYA